MNETMLKVTKRSQGCCEICSSPDMVQRHHIVKGKGKRKQHENEYSVIALCYSCHHGTFGVHGRNGSTLDKRLKLWLQNVYKNKGYSTDEIRTMMGGKIVIDALDPIQHLNLTDEGEER